MLCAALEAAIVGGGGAIADELVGTAKPADAPTPIPAVPTPPTAPAVPAAPTPAASGRSVLGTQSKDKVTRRPSTRRRAKRQAPKARRVPVAKPAPTATPAPAKPAKPGKKRGCRKDSTSSRGWGRAQGAQAEDAAAVAPDGARRAGDAVGRGRCRPASACPPSSSTASGSRPSSCRSTRRRASEYGVRWEVLAAINEIETDYGRNLDVSSAGALGWMQFMPGTWRATAWTPTATGRGPLQPGRRDLRRRPLPARGGGRPRPAARDLRLQPRRLVRRLRCSSAPADQRPARRAWSARSPASRRGPSPSTAGRATRVDVARAARQGAGAPGATASPPRSRRRRIRAAAGRRRRGRQRRKGRARRKGPAGSGASSSSGRLRQRLHLRPPRARSPPRIPRPGAQAVARRSPGARPAAATPGPRRRRRRPASSATRGPRSRAPAAPRAAPPGAPVRPRRPRRTVGRRGHPPRPRPARLARPLELSRRDSVAGGSTGARVVAGTVLGRLGRAGRGAAAPALRGPPRRPRRAPHRSQADPRRLAAARVDGPLRRPRRDPFSAARRAARRSASSC